MFFLIIGMLVFLQDTNTVLGLTCSYCSDVVRPQDCFTNTTCGTDKLCAVTQYMTATTTEWRYNLKCMPKLFCSALTPGSPNNMCVKCCSSDGCNRNLCNNVGGTTTQTTAKPTTTKPTTAKPTTAKPTTAKPTTAKPTTKPTTAKPTTKPTTAKPTIPTLPTTSTTKLTTTRTVPITTIGPPSVTATTKQIYLSVKHQKDHFSCQGTNADVMKIYEDQKLIHLHTITNQKNYVFSKDVVDWTKKEYVCEAINTKTGQKAYVHIQVHVTGEKPYFPVTEATDVYVTHGDHVALSCIPEGTPKPTITWSVPRFRNRNSYHQISYHYDKIELEIKAMTPDLEGTYTCAAHNPLGTATISYHVRYKNETATTLIPKTTTTTPVLVKPDVFLDKQITVTEGETTVAIACVADGIPTPAIRWSMAQGMMPSNVRQYNNYLLIHNVAYKDSRYYLCAATNEVGSTMEVIHVMVLPRPHVPPVIKLPSSLQVKYNAHVTLDCKTTGYPLPEVTWSFNGRYLAKSEIITINKATITDIGGYTCTAKNDAGSDEKTLFLLVNGSPPNIEQSQPTSIATSPSKKVILKCIATGEPAPQLTWIFKPFVGTSSSIHQSLSSDNSTLTLSHIDKSGTVTCKASNPFGQIQSSFSVISMPDAVVGK